MIHSFLAPSAADIWAYCAGHPLLTTMYPDDDTPDAREGEASHWVGSEVLQSYKPTDDTVLSVTQLIGKEAPNKTIITEEMADCAEVYIGEVLRTCQQHGLVSNLHIEERVAIPRVHETCFGTPDAWAYKAPDLWLWDYKFGHRDVKPTSWQLITYIAGLLEGIDDQTTTVHLCVVQPRSYHSSGPIKTVEVLASDLRADINHLAAQAEKAVSPNPDVTSGQHCRDCPARHQCAAARFSAAAAFEYTTSALPETLTPDGLSFELNMLERGIKAMEHRHEALKADAIGRLKLLQQVPGYDTEMGHGNRAWAGSVNDMTIIGDQFGVDLRSSPKLITPAQADKAIKAENVLRKAAGKPLLAATILDQWIRRGETGLKLINTDEAALKQFFKQTKE